MREQQGGALQPFGVPPQTPGSPARRKAPLAHVLPHQGKLRAHRFALHARGAASLPNGRQPVGDPIDPLRWASVCFAKP